MTVYRASARTARLTGPELDLPCALGKSGLIAADLKREGDKASPIGVWPVRRAYWRHDRLEKPDTPLIIDPITASDGWCDAADDPAYNQPVRLPYPASAETLMRDDGLYDLVVVLGHNDNPPQPRLGSAIFLHCASPEFKPTLGCVAIQRDALIDLVKTLTPADAIEITD